MIIAIVKSISKKEIKLLERWKSDAIDIYINKLAEIDYLEKLLHLNSRLHILLNNTHLHTSQLHLQFIYNSLSWLQQRHIFDSFISFVLYHFDI